MQHGATTDGWVRRGELPATPAAVNPGGGRPGWLDWTRGQLQAWGLRRLLRYTGGRVELAVDLGCGYGDWTARLASIASQVIAVDVAPGFVAETQLRLAATGHRAWQVTCDDLRRFRAFDHADLVHLGAVLMYVETRDALDILTAARDRLVPGGVLHQREWCAIHLGRPSHQARHGLTSFHRTPAQYVELARRAGLQLIEQRRSGAIYGEQLAHATIGLRREALTRATAWLPSLVGRVVGAPFTRGSVSFFFRRV